MSHKIKDNSASLEREEILKIYNHRCVICYGLASEVNEINPRARSKDNIKNRKNRVALCSYCHSNFHHDGVTPEKIKIMQERRVEFLLMIGKEEEI